MVKEWIEYYSNGSIKYEGEFENDKKVERKNSKRDVHEESFDELWSDSEKYFLNY